MTAGKYPGGWNEARISRVLKHYESQTDDEVAAEVRIAKDEELVPGSGTKLVPQFGSAKV